MSKPLDDEARTSLQDLFKAIRGGLTSAQMSHLASLARHDQREEFMEAVASLPGLLESLAPRGVDMDEVHTQEGPAE